MADWTIQNMIRNAEDGGVVVVYWKASLDEDYTVGHRTHKIAPQQVGQCEFRPDPSKDGFVPFEALTEDAVLAWVFGAISKETVEKDLQDRADAKKNSISKFVGGMPWESA